MAITLVQGSGYLTYISSQGAIDDSIPRGIFWFCNIIILATGTVFAMWLGERITDRGLGNGVSLLIMVGILARLPQAFVAELLLRLDNGGLLILVIELFALFAVIIAMIVVIQGVRKIPIQFAKRMVGRGASAMPVAGQRDYIPLKVNAAGVMPIIFAQALMFLPATAAQFVGGDNVATSPFLLALNDYTSVTYNAIYFALVLIFTYVYTALMVNPQQYAEYLKRQNAFIPGIKPGKDTAEFIDAITTRITLPGSIFSVSSQFYLLLHKAWVSTQRLPCFLVVLQCLF